MRRADSGRLTSRSVALASNPGIVDAILRRKSVPRGGENNHADLSSGRESIPLPCRDRNILGALPARGRDTRSAGDADARGAHPHGRVQSHLAPLEDAFRQPIPSSLPEKELGSVPPQLILPRHASQKFDELVIRVGATNLQPVSHTHAVAIT